MASTAVFALAVAFTAGCYLPPSRSNSPIHSPDGVSVVLVGEDCEDQSGSGEFHSSTHDLAIKLRFDNRTAETLQILPKSILLQNGMEKVVPVEPSTAGRLGPGQRREFVFRYLHQADCRSELQITFDAALRLAGRTITVRPLEFTPY